MAGSDGSEGGVRGRVEAIDEGGAEAVECEFVVDDFGDEEGTGRYLG